MSPPAEVPPVRPLPLWLATGLVQAGSFALVLGVGVLLISAAYGAGSTWLGLGLIAGGYAAVGFPGWYLARLPVHRSRLRALRARR